MSTATEATPPETPPTPTARLLHDIALERPLRDPVRSRRILLGLGGAVVLLALVLTTLRVTGLVGGESQAEKDEAAIEQVQEQVLPELQDLMAQRETFFTAERQYLSAVPDRKAEPLQQVADDMTRLRGQLQEVRPGPAVTTEAHDYLLEAVTLLARNAARNAKTLAKPRGPYVLVAVKNENALTAIKRMNKSLLYVLDAAQLPVSDFDLPGGTDPHKGDHSSTM